jgi:hypothetical protein
VACRVWLRLRVYHSAANPPRVVCTSQAALSSSLPFYAIAVSNGYFAYDTWDMLQNGMAAETPYLMLHHVALLITFTLGCWKVACGLARPPRACVLRS